MKEFARERVMEMEYTDGVLSIGYFPSNSTPENPSLVVEMIPWNRIRCIYWDGPGVPSRLPIPFYPVTY